MIGVEVDATDAHWGAMHVDVGVEFGFFVYGQALGDGVAGEKYGLGNAVAVDAEVVLIAAVGKAVGELDMA